MADEGDMYPDVNEPALEKDEGVETELPVFFSVKECADSFESYLKNMLNHVEEKEKIAVIIRLNAMLQAAAKDLTGA